MITNDFIGDYTQWWPPVPEFIDLDGDSLLDLLIGNKRGVLEHYKQDCPNSTSFSYVTNYFSSIDVGFKSSPEFTDIDGDGLLDLLIGEQDGNLNHYEQDGLNSTSFYYVTDNFNSINVGENSSPTFTDIDSDGLLDLIIGEQNGNLNHYEQDAINSTSFSYVTDNFNSIDIGTASSPVFQDSDGHLELIIGESGGRLYHYEQDAINSNSFSYVTNNFSSIDVGYHSQPDFADIDGDHLLDLIVGDDNGLLNHYEEMDLASISIGEITIGVISEPKRYCISANNLLDDLHIECTAGFRISLSEETGFSQNLWLTPLGGMILDTVFVRFEPDSVKLYEGNIIHTSFLATSKYIQISGTGVETNNFPGTALEFDGSDDYVLLTSTPELRPSNNFTIEAWIKPNDIINNQIIFMHDENGGGNDGYALSIQDEHACFFANNGYAQVIISDEAVVANNWNHIAGVYDNSVLKIYVNGVEKSLVGTGDVVYSLQTSVNIGRRGGTYHPNTLFYNGKMDEIRFWNVARNSVQIRESMYLPVSGHNNGIICYWQFNDGKGTVLKDVISGYDGDLINMDDADWVESTIPFGPGVSETQTETAGTVDFTGAGLSMFFNSQNGAEVTVTRIDTIANMMPAETGTVLDSQYWVVNRFGTGTFDTDITFTVNEDLTESQQDFPGQIRLYTRSGTADTNWVYLSNANSVDAAEDKVAFTNITGLGQFILGTESHVDSFVGTALEFDGVDDYVQISINSPQTDYTYELFFKTSDANAKISSVRNPSLGSSNDRNLYLENGNIFHRLWNEEIIGSTGQNFADNTWHHVAVVVESGIGQRIYLDGELVASGIKDSSDFDWDTSLDIGYNGGYFEGKTEEIRLWNVVRTETQIRENMYLPPKGYESGLVGYWQFNDGSGTVLKDGISGNNGILVTMDDSDWIESTIPFGPGFSNTQIETAGTVDFTGTSLSMNFNSQGNAEITVTRIDTLPNINPTGLEDVYDTQYWVVNRTGTGTFEADLTFKVNEDLTIAHQEFPGQIKLYTRSATADINWIHLADAVSVNAAEDKVTFANITGFGQFIIGELYNPDIDVDPVSLSKSLPSGQTFTKKLNISNIGQQGTILDYSIHIDFTQSGGGNGDNIAGSTFEGDVPYYDPGTTVDIFFTIYNNSPDDDWLDGASLDFPEGVTVNSSTDFIGGSSGPLLTDYNSGNGVLISWTDQNGGYGNIKNGESATSIVNVSVSSSFTGDMVLDWTLSGEEYGSTPHDIAGTITMLRNPWLTVNPESGDCAFGETDSLTVVFNAVSYNAGKHTANIIISSNDPDEPEVIVPVTLVIPDVDEFPGTALEFDGIDDYVLLGSTPDLRSSNNFTIEAWIKPNDLISDQVIFMHDENGGGNDGYALAISEEHALFHAHNGSSQVITSDVTIVANCWNHIAAVYDNSVLKIYVNGVEKSQAGSGDVIYSITNFVNIGRRGGTYLPNTGLYEGKLDEIRNKYELKNITYDPKEFQD